MKIGDIVRFKSAVIKRCGYDKTLADLKGEVTAIFGKTCDVKFTDRHRSVPIANIEMAAGDKCAQKADESLKRKALETLAG